MKKTLITKAILAFGGNVTNDTINNLSADTINNLSAYTIKNLSADTIKNLSADTINNLSADTINNLSAYTIKNLSAYTINNLSADTINNLSADTINNLSAYTINNLSADTIKNLSADTIKNFEKLWASVPLIENPYTTLLADIKEKRRVHNQSTFGPECDPATNLCGTQMCTAGHLVNMGGSAGYALKSKFGWEKAAALLHIKVHPDAPTQNFGGIAQSDALAYIEMMAEFEGRKNKKQKFENWLKSVMEAE